MTRVHVQLGEIMGVSSEKQSNPQLNPVGDSEVQTDRSISSTSPHEDEDLIEPSEEDIANLRHIGSKIQATAWLVALFSGAERFAWYALQAPLRE